MLDIISICTASLGLFLCLPLLALSGRRHANLWLGLFTFSLSALSVAPMISNYRIAWFGLLDWPFTCIGVFYYFYVCNVVGVQNNRWRWLHFLPGLVTVCTFLFVRATMSQEDWITLLFNPQRPVFATVLLGFQIIASSYAVAVLFRIAAFHKQVRENYSSLRGRDLSWISYLTGIILFMVVIWIPSSMFEPVAELMVAARMLTLYFIGWYGLRQLAVFIPATSENAAPPSEPEIAAEPSTPPAQDKYARSGMTDAARELIGQRLARRSAEVRDFLDNDLSLTELAERVGTSPQLLSEYLNKVLGMTFFDYINGLRIAEVQRLMADEDEGKRAILDLAFAAGFSSKSTFNAAFKKITGMAPSTWRNAHLRTSEPIG